jgi:hypothetical protein
MRQITVFIDLQDQLNCMQSGIFLHTKYHAAALLTANAPLQQHTIPHAVICSLTLLMMDIVLSETCWADLEDQ